jgi:uncharacterized membrane protein YeaQ/YmgE (transglycosylase-associated protein family)
MDVQALVIFLAIGAVAGWLAGTLMKGGGFGLLGNIIVGVIGALVGGLLFGFLGITATGLIGSIVTATVGAVLLLFLVGLIKKGYDNQTTSPSQGVCDHRVGFGDPTIAAYTRGRLRSRFGITENGGPNKRRIRIYIFSSRSCREKGYSEEAVGRRPAAKAVKSILKGAPSFGAIQKFLFRPQQDIPGAPEKVSGCSRVSERIGPKLSAHWHCCELRTQVSL